LRLLIKPHNALLAALQKPGAMFSFAVGWAGCPAGLFEWLVANPKQVGKVVVGLEMGQTNPHFVAWAMDCPQVRFVGRAFGGSFHPMLFVVQHAAGFDLFCGSAAFAQGGMQRNAEAVVHTTEADAGGRVVLKSALAQIDDAFSNASPFSRDEATLYESRYATNTALLRQAQGRVIARSGGGGHHHTPAFVPFNAPLLQMTWQTFLQRVQPPVISKPQPVQKVALFAHSSPIPPAQLMAWLVQQPDAKAATKWLAATRPELFFEANPGAWAGVCAGLGIAETPFGVAAYADVCAQLQLSRWWASPLPTQDHEAPLWHQRVALLPGIVAEATR